MEKPRNSMLDFELYFRQSPEMLCILDYSGNLIRANHAFEKVLGLTEEEIKAKPFTHLFFPDDLNTASSGLPILKPGGYESKVLCGDGTYKWLSWSFITIEEEELTCAIVQDVSRVKELENRLIEANRQAQAAIDNLCDPVFVLDMEGHIISLNTMAEKLAARKKREVTGKRIWDVIPQTINAVLYKEYHKIIAEKTIHSMETYHPTREQWYNVRIYPTENGMILHYHDITSYKQTEAALRLQERAYQHAPPLMAIVSYPELKIIDVNERFLNMLGFYREEVIGQQLRDLGIETGEKDAIDWVNDDLAKNGMVKNRAVRFKTKAGVEGSGLLSADSFTMGEKQLFILSLNDNTDNIDQQKEQLRIEQLNLAAQIASGLAHEVRNPLTTVSGLLQVLVRKEEFIKYKEYVDIINSELSRVNNIIDECLSLGQQTGYGKKILSLNSIIKDTGPLLHAYALDMGQEVTFELGHIPELLLDEIDIRQLVVNLVRNGLEAMSGKGVKGKVRISTYMEDGDVVLTVRDEGGGIEQPVLDKMGIPFYSTKKKGTGLGLAKCYNTVFKHGAVINIITGTDGTTFCIRFGTEITETDEN